MLENYKIKVEDESESKEAQELFFELGFIFRTGLGVKHLDCKFLYARNGIIEVGYDSDNFECSANKETTLDKLRNLVAEKKNESCLISDADALRALADGKDVEYRAKEENEYIWYSPKELTIESISSGSYLFRLKPRTINLNGIDIPTPFEPRVGYPVWFIDDNSNCGYSNSWEYGPDISSFYGFWRTEEEIKQVVAALRSVFK